MNDPTHLTIDGNHHLPIATDLNPSQPLTTSSSQLIQPNLHTTTKQKMAKSVCPVPLLPVAGSLIQFDGSVNDNDDDDGLSQSPQHHQHRHHHHDRPVGVEGVEILVMGSMASSTAPAIPRKEDEQITSAVMKVLQGYQWSLVPTTTK